MSGVVHVALIADRPICKAEVGISGEVRREPGLPGGFGATWWAVWLPFPRGGSDSGLTALIVEIH